MFSVLIWLFFRNGGKRRGNLFNNFSFARVRINYCPISWLLCPLCSSQSGPHRRPAWDPRSKGPESSTECFWAHFGEFWWKCSRTVQNRTVRPSGNSSLCGEFVNLLQKEVKSNVWPTIQYEAEKRVSFWGIFNQRSEPWMGAAESSDVIMPSSLV